MVIIRDYSSSDEDNWIQCQLQSYLESPYYDVLNKFKPRYENPAIELIALVKGNLVGILDIEIEQKKGQFCFDETERSGMISVIGVLLQYRRKSIGSKLIEKGIELVRDNFDVHRIEIWIREDPVTILWLKKNQFQKIHKFYEVILTTDFFDKYQVELPFGIIPSFLTGNVESEGFFQLTQQHPPERTFPILIYERWF
ncbi:MAG: GNAT family N-acetyltransferase [Candidatus Heimdallarchaeota archaeon]|nr:MAG: GNAT family N-acetyltransferase [Candidatus Heimdallarchaeota archaeon]